MIHILNRALLCTETNPQAAAKLRAALQAAGIPCRIKRERSGAAKAGVRIPKTGRTGFMGPNAGSYTGSVVPHSWVEGGSSQTAHLIYVKRSDLKRAKALRDLEE